MGNSPCRPIFDPLIPITKMGPAMALPPTAGGAPKMVMRAERGGGATLPHSVRFAPRIL